MIHFLVDMDSLREIEADLNITKDKSRMVLRNAINRTAARLKKRLPEEAEERYQVKRKSSLRKDIKVKKARVSDLVAIVSSKGKPMDVYDFNVNPRPYNPRNRPRLGHKANVVRENLPKFLMLRPNAARDKYRGFVVRYKNGHISVAQREPGTRMRSNPKKEAIKNLYSLSVPAMLSYEMGVYGKLSEETQGFLLEEIRRQMLRSLG